MFCSRGKSKIITNYLTLSLYFNCSKSYLRYFCRRAGLERERSCWALTRLALLLGGVGGWEEVMVTRQQKKQITAGTNHTMFIRGTSSGHFTKVGVIPCPNTMPMGMESERMPVATNLSDSENQF